MSKSILILGSVFFLFSFCKKKDNSSNPLPSQTNETILVHENCIPGVWQSSRYSNDTVEIKNGLLKIVSLHAKQERHFYTSTNSNCWVKADFTLKISVPFIKLSDTLNNGSMGISLTEVLASVNGAQNTPKTYNAMVSTFAVYAGTVPPLTINYLGHAPSNAQFIFTRKANELTSKVYFEGDSIVSKDPSFGSRDLILNFVVLCDSSAAKSSVIKIDEIQISGGGGSFESTDFNSGVIK